MSSTLVRSLDALADWRRALDRGVQSLARFLADQDLLDAGAEQQVDALRQRLGGDRLVLAFVAEFSRGKSELINAIFFADAGRRVLPATPGRTTMCPVELSWDADDAPGLLLLPIDTRLRAQPLAELRQHPDLWRRVPFTANDADSLADALAEVKRTVRVSIDDARALGFWHDDNPDDNPPVDIDGKAEIPAWRHALINYPHPLLKRGLVVIDTPGLNAVGAEPELTLSLLPSAHATVFILGADTGVTRSDLAIWRDHLAGRALERFAVLNKIDALADPLASADEIREMVQRQCESVAATLELSVERVFPVSAREALAGRIAGNAAQVTGSRLPALEEALSQQLEPQRSAVISRIVGEAVRGLQQTVSRRLFDQRRHVTEQLIDLRGLRGKSDSKVRVMLERVQRDAADFERCTERLGALKAVHARHLKQITLLLGSDRLRREIAYMRRDSDATFFKLGAKKAFVEMGARLQEALTQAHARAQEIEQMLAGSWKELNTEFGFALSVAPLPEMTRYSMELAQIQDSYVRYLGLSNALRLAEPGFLDQFTRMLLSKLRVVFENASGEIEMWSKSAAAQVEAQLRDRRRSFKRRADALERIRAASSELEQRIAEVEQQEARLNGWLHRIDELCASVRAMAETPPLPSSDRAPHLSLVHSQPAIDAA